METVWITYDGREIPLHKMSPTHLRRAILLCEQLEFSPCPFQGDMAVDHFESMQYDASRMREELQYELDSRKKETINERLKRIQDGE